MIYVLIPQSAKHVAFVLNNITKNLNMYFLYAAIGICSLSITLQLLMRITPCFCDTAFQIPPKIIPKGVKYISGNETSLVQNLHLGQWIFFDLLWLCSKHFFFLSVFHPNHFYLYIFLYIAMSNILSNNGCSMSSASSFCQ